MKIAWNSELEGQSIGCMLHDRSSSCLLKDSSFHFETFHNIRHYHQMAVIVLQPRVTTVEFHILARCIEGHLTCLTC